MPEFDFEREVRTPYSEAYTILEDNRLVGRVDIHLTFSLIHATLVVDESLTQQEIHELIAAIDEDILDAVGINREELIIHVFQGRETGVYADNGFGENGNEH
jgi:divalent metal cation (Fe/Co/Zn/Cd) transporter